MEDKVPFKAFTYWKGQSKPEVRRFGIENNLVTSYCYLDAKLKDVFHGLRNKRYTVSWKDEEGDEVIISSDEEMIIALSAMNDYNFMKLYIYCDDEEPKVLDGDVMITVDCNAPADDNLPHHGVICDVCNTPVVGFRYKCTSCADYDLCSKCESNGQHSQHIMVRVPTPNLPRTTIREAIRRSRHIIKTVASSATEPEGAYKRSKSERIADKKRHHSYHTEGSRGSDRHPGSDCHPTGQRSGWVSALSTFINEFADLAGDMKIIEKDDGAAFQTVQNVVQGQTKDCANAQNAAPNEPEAATSGASANEAVYVDLNPNSIRRLVKAALGPEMGKYLTSMAPSLYDPDSDDDENNQECKQQSEANKQSVKSNGSSTTKEVNGETKKDASPERASDGWTVINNEKDMMDTDATASAPNEQATIGFNLPQEFQERVRIGSGQSLYPPLHSAAAVLNPKEPENQTTTQEHNAKAEAKVPVAEPVKKKISQPSTSQPLPQPQPSQSSITYHFKPHIDAAIKQMLAMGFTNEGGWLTQLLESKDGNIAAVLDLLTPVIPKK